MDHKEYWYPVNVEWTEGRLGVLKMEGKSDLAVATPPEFGGPEGVASPEDLFVASAAVCVMSTFLAMADKVKARFKTFSCQGRGLLEAVPNKGMLFTRLDLYPKVVVPSADDTKAVERALDLAGRYCLVTNSMKTEVSLHPEIEVG